MGFTAPSEADIMRIVELVVEVARPVRVVLFGSAARGELRAGSDLDLMVVVPEGSDTLLAARELYRARTAAGETNVPVDFVVVTTSEFEQHRQSIGMVYRDVARDGRELYVA